MTYGKILSQILMRGPLDLVLKPRQLTSSSRGHLHLEQGLNNGFVSSSSLTKAIRRGVITKTMLIVRRSNRPGRMPNILNMAQVTLCTFEVLAEVQRCL